jgi:hypothetical protein
MSLLRDKASSIGIKLGRFASNLRDSKVILNEVFFGEAPPPKKRYTRYYIQGYYPQQFLNRGDGIRALESIKEFRLYDKDEIEMTHMKGLYGIKIKDKDVVYPFVFDSQTLTRKMIMSIMSNEPVRIECKRYVLSDEHLYIRAQTKNEYIKEDEARRDLTYVHGLYCCRVEERIVVR